MARALELGEAEGLEAVSLRRLASDLGVTPMALYRHVKDKQDLINAMTDAVLEDFDLTVGFTATMSWSDRMRQALRNFREQMEARPLALPLAIAYSGENPTSFWRSSEVLLDVLLEAGFARRQAIVLIRVISNLVSGYLLLMHEDAGADWTQLNPQEVDVLRKRVELAILSLPGDRFPNLVASADDLSDVWVRDPDLYWQDTVDVLVFGLERMLERRGNDARER